MIKKYVGGGTPQFVEGVVFKIFLPVKEPGSEELKSTMLMIKDKLDIQARRGCTMASCIIYEYSCGVSTLLHRLGVEDPTATEAGQSRAIK